MMSSFEIMASQALLFELMILAEQEYPKWSNLLFAFIQLFPVETQQAMACLENQQINTFNDGNFYITEIVSPAERIQVVLPIPFCSCENFYNKVVRQRESSICKHIIAAIIARR